MTVARLGWLAGGNLTPPTADRAGGVLKGGPLLIITGTEGKKLLIYLFIFILKTLCKQVSLVGSDHK